MKKRVLRRFKKSAVKSSLVSRKLKTDLFRLINTPNIFELIKSKAKIQPKILRLAKNKKVAVFSVNFAGRKFVIKQAKFEEVALKNSRTIFREHIRALKSGEIKAQKYRLTPLIYVAANSKGSVMLEVSGVGLDTLRYKPDSKSSIDFFKKYPFVTKSALLEAKVEIENDLRVLYGKGVIPSFDTGGTDNIIVRGVDRKSGKIIVALVDQIAPSHELYAIKFFQKEKKAS